MDKKISDFKLISIILMSLIIFFTLYYFRILPMQWFDINIDTVSANVVIYYNILAIIVATLTTIIFMLTYFKKDDDELKRRYKSIGIGLGVIFLYFFLPYLQGIPFSILGLETDTLPVAGKVIYLIAFNSVIAALIMLIYNKKITADFQEMKKNSTKIFNKYLKYWLLGLFIMMISNLIINLFITNNLPNNEQAIRDMFDISPIYIFFSAVIFAPIVEELVFRYSFKKIFSNKWLFIILSGLIFGGMHVFNDFKAITDIFYIIPYSTPGIIFAYMLYDSDNVLVPMSFHFIHNGILISLQILLMLIG